MKRRPKRERMFTHARGRHKSATPMVREAAPEYLKRATRYPPRGVGREGARGRGYGRVERVMSSGSVGQRPIELFLRRSFRELQVEAPRQYDADAHQLIGNRDQP